MKVIVFGAGGGLGSNVVKYLLAQGDEVTAFSRPARTAGPAPRRRPVAYGETAHSAVRRVHGNVMDPADVERAIAGQDAVVSALGINENTLRIWLLGPKNTPIHVRSVGALNMVNAMRKCGVPKLVLCSSFGVGDTRWALDRMGRFFYDTVLGTQMNDMFIQDQIVKGSGLKWVLVHPVHLGLKDHVDEMPFASSTELRGRLVSRAMVGRFMAHAVHTSEYDGRVVMVSKQDAAKSTVKAA